MKTTPEHNERIAKMTFASVYPHMMKKASGEDQLWSSSVIGFGNKRYKSPGTGREVDWLLIGFSPRKANMSLYLSYVILRSTLML